MAPPSDRAIRSNLFARRKKDFLFYPLRIHYIFFVGNTGQALDHQ